MREQGKHRKPRWWWWAGRKRGQQEVSQPLGFLSLLIDGDDRQAHQLTEQAYEEGLRGGAGYYQVLCGRVIPVASMVTPPGHPCPSCQQLGART